RPCEFDPDGRPGRSGLPRAPASGRSLLDAARRRGDERHRHRMAAALSAGPRPGPPPCRARAGSDSRMTGLSGKRVLITGGGTGTGADLARGFHAAGAEVVIAGRRAAPLDAVAARLPGCRTLIADVTDEAS